MNLPDQLVSAARSLGLGKLKLYGYHRPIGLVKKSIAEGGPIEQWRTERGRREMVAAAERLPSLSPPKEDFGARVYFLSGERFWYQTAFCFASLQIQSPFRITPIVFDDGTLNHDVRIKLSNIVPWVEFVGHEIIMNRLDDFLPIDRYPSLRNRRLEYPHLRKLTDLHTGQSDWGLVLDSDMLFFKPPTEILSWFSRPTALFMQDIDNAYGYSPELMAELAQAPVLSKVNVGLYAVDRSKLNWDYLEFACRIQIERERPNYLQEQALTALALTRQDARPLDAKDYQLLPSYIEGRHPTAALHHYVAHTKRSYFNHGWRHILNKTLLYSKTNTKTRDI